MPNPITVSTNNLTNPGGGPLFIPRGSMIESISLICIVTLHNLVDIPVIIGYTWSGNNFTKYYSVDSNSINSNNTITINNLTLENAGIYTCRVDVNSTNTFITETGTKMNTTNVALCKLLETFMMNSIIIKLHINFYCR